MFYEHFKEACEQKKRSPSAVVLDAGMSKANITNWKAGQEPTLDTIVRLAAQLGISPRELVPESLN